MLSLYFGENAYSLSKKKKELLESARENKTSWALFNPLNKIDPNYLAQFLGGDDFFSSRKQIFFVDFLTEGPATETSMIHKQLKENLKTIKGAAVSIFFFEQKPDKKNPLFGFLKKEAEEVIETKALKGRELESFLEEEASRLGLAADKNAISRLLFLTGYDCWGAVNELKKLSLLKNGEAITAKDIEELTSFELSANIFNTIDAMSRGDRKTAFHLLEKHLSEGYAPQYLLTMIVYQFRSLIKVKAASQKGLSPELISKSLKIHPFVVRKVSGFTERFTLEKLRGIYKKIAQIDYNSKRGELDLETALYMLIAYS